MCYQYMPSANMRKVRGTVSCSGDAQGFPPLQSRPQSWRWAWWPGRRTACTGAPALQALLSCPTGQTSQAFHQAAHTVSEAVLLL